MSDAPHKTPESERTSAAPVECEEAVIKKIRLRRNAGRNKYGTTMERTDLTRLQWLQHAQEEAMDLAIYLERLIREERQNAELCGGSEPSASASGSADF